MIDFIKKFKTMVPEVVQLVLVGVIAVYTLAFRVSYSTPVFNVLANFLPVSLIVCSAVLLVVFKKSLAGHAILLLGLYINGLTIFINALFSLSFSPFSYTPGFTPEIFINLIIFIYLALIVVSYLISGGISTKPLKGQSLMLGALLFAFAWIFQGFYSAVIMLALPLIALLIGLEFPALILMLSVVIEEPFSFINNAINNSLGWRSISYYVYLLGSLFFIYLFSIGIYKAIKNKSYQS